MYGMKEGNLLSCLLTIKKANGRQCECMLSQILIEIGFFFVFKSKFEWLFMSSSDLYFGCMNSHSVISKSREALELFLYIEF